MDITTKAASDYRDPSRISVQIISDIEHPSHERRLGIRLADWNRIRRNIGRVPAVPPSLAAAYWSLFGIAASIFATIIPLYFPSGLSDLAKTIFMAVAIGCLIAGIAVRWLEKFFLKTRASSTKDLESEMDEILADLSAGSQTESKRETGEEI